MDFHKAILYCIFLLTSSIFIGHSIALAADQVTTENKTSTFQSSQNVDLIINSRLNVDGNLVFGSNNTVVTNIYKSADYKKILERKEYAKTKLESFKERANNYPDDKSFKEKVKKLEINLDKVNNEMVFFEKDLIALTNKIYNDKNNKINLDKAKDFLKNGFYQEAKIYTEISSNQSNQSNQISYNNKGVLIQAGQNANVIFEASIDNNGDVVVGSGNKVVTNIYNSSEVNDLLDEQKELYFDLDLTLYWAKKYPQDNSFKEDLTFIQERINQVAHDLSSLKGNIIGLAIDLSKDNLSSPRLSQARSFFEKGEFTKARLYMESEVSKIDDEIASLKKEKNNINQLSAINYDQFETKANELLLLGRLTGIDYSLPEKDRLEKAKEYFRKAISISESPMVFFSYAGFLNQNNQYEDAKIYYEKALSKIKVIAKDNVSKYKPLKVMILAGFGVLLGNNKNMRKESENLLRDALDGSNELFNNDQRKYISFLADSLSNLANILSKDISSDEPEKLYRRAIELRKKLVREKPSLNEERLAGDLSNLALFLSRVSNGHEKSETLYREAIQIQRKISKTNEDSELKLAGYLFNLANLLKIRNKNWSEAEGVYREALLIYRRFMVIKPSVVKIDLFTALNGFAGFLSKNNKVEEASSLYQEALDISRTLVIINADAYEQALADVLYTYGGLLIRMNDNVKAASLLNESLGIRERFAQKYPYVGKPLVCDVKRDLAVALENMGEYIKAEKNIRDAVSLSREIVQENKKYGNKGLAHSLNNLAFFLDKHSKNHKEVEDSYKESLNIYDELIKDDFLSYASYKILSLNNFANFLKNDRRKDAEQFYMEALNIYRKLLTYDKFKYEFDYAINLAKLGDVYINWKRYDEAKSFLEESISIIRPYAYHYSSNIGHLYSDILYRLIIISSSKESDYCSLVSDGRKYAQTIELKSNMEEIYNKKCQL